MLLVEVAQVDGAKACAFDREDGVSQTSQFEVAAPFDVFFGDWFVPQGAAEVRFGDLYADEEQADARLLCAGVTLCWEHQKCTKDKCQRSRQ